MKPLMNKPFSASLLAAAVLVTAWLATGCAASNAGAGSSSPPAARGSSVEVFGVIDAGVSHTTTKSGR